jgi:hypothetical protein
MSRLLQPRADSTNALAGEGAPAVEPLSRGDILRVIDWLWLHDRAISLQVGGRLSLSSPELMVVAYLISPPPPIHPRIATAAAAAAAAAATVLHSA